MDTGRYHGFDYSGNEQDDDAFFFIASFNVKSRMKGEAIGTESDSSDSNNPVIPSVSHRGGNFLAQYDANILQSTSTPTVPSPQINLRAFNSIINYQGMDHISDDDLERFHLGKIMDDAELAIIEEHLLWCARCLDAAIEAAQYVDAMRVALIGGNFDLA